METRLNFFNSNPAAMKALMSLDQQTAKSGSSRRSSNSYAFGRRSSMAALTASTCMPRMPERLARGIGAWPRWQSGKKRPSSTTASVPR